MKKQINYEEKLLKKKFKRPPKLVYWAYHFILHILYKKYRPNFEIVDDINKEKGPCFVIFNHLSRIDHYYVMEACYPKRINILAGYNEFFRSHLHNVFMLNEILPKKQYVNDIPSMKAMMSIIRQGGTIAFAPEGLSSNDGMNKPIVPGTAHLLKHFNIPVYFVELKGQYLQNTKVCLDERFGKTFAKISLFLTPEELKSMTDEEIEDKINDAFRIDEYEWQKEKQIKWETKGRICHRLEDILFYCPRCHSLLTNEGTGNTIVCKSCNNGALMDDYYNFLPFDDKCIIPDTPSKWVNEERVEIIKKIRSDDNFIFEESVKIGRIPKDHLIKNHQTSEIVGNGKLTVSHNGITYKGENTDKYDFSLDWKTIYTTITELDLSYFNIYVNGEYTDIFPENHSSYLITMLIEEMHRLHVNFYKNFKWNNWMYE